jgi:hypothetical protein
MSGMSERVSLGSGGKRLGVSGDVRRVGSTKVTTARLEAWEHEPSMWLRREQARKRQPARKAVGWLLVLAFNVAGSFDRCADRIAVAGEPARTVRAAALRRAAFLNAPGEPGADG